MDFTYCITIYLETFYLRNENQDIKTRAVSRAVLHYTIFTFNIISLKRDWHTLSESDAFWFDNTWLQADSTLSN